MAIQTLLSSKHYIELDLINSIHSVRSSITAMRTLLYKYLSAMDLSSACLRQMRSDYRSVHQAPSHAASSEDWINMYNAFSVSCCEQIGSGHQDSISE